MVVGESDMMSFLSAPKRRDGDAFTFVPTALAVRPLT